MQKLDKKLKKWNCDRTFGMNNFPVESNKNFVHNIKGGIVCIKRLRLSSYYQKQ